MWAKHRHSLDKHEEMHFGTSNQGRTVKVNNRAPESVVVNGDLRVQVYSSLNVTTQADRVVRKVFYTSAFISKPIEYRGCAQDVVGERIVRANN